jgi:exonuclease SbcC
MLEGRATSIKRHLVGAAQQLRTLIPIAHDLDRKADAIRCEKRELQHIELGLADQLANADAANEGLEALARVEQILNSLKRAVPQLKVEAERLRLEQKSLATAEQELDGAVAAATELQKQAEQAEATEAAAALKASAAQERLAKARQRLGAYREATVAHDSHLKQLSELECGLRARRKTLDDAQTKQKEAEGARDDARAALEAVLRAQAAVHAAQEAAPGDPCPICIRPLPAGFEPPPWQEQGAAVRALGLTEKELGEAQTRLATAKAELRQGETLFAEARQRRVELAAKADEAARSVLELVPSAHLRSGDDAVLTPLAQEAAALLEQATRLRQRAKECRREADRADAELDPRRKALGRRRQDFERDQKKLETSKQQHESDRATIPATLRPPAPLTLDGIRAAGEQVGARLANLRRVEKEARETRDRLGALGERASALDQESRTKLEKPRHQAEKALALLFERVSEAAPASERPLPLAEGVPLDQAASQADKLERAATRLIEDLKRSNQDSLQNAEASRTEARRILEDVGAADEEALGDLLVSAATAVKEAEAERDRARAQEPKAADLDRRISEGERFLASLEELARLVTDGRFVGHVVARRQRALLAVASEILGTMSGARYGFSEDFQVVDGLSGQPRSVRTLSGGETFLASLALALGLVELAGRSGGRLEAIFLDEGFGSLDANALDEALAELERRAGTGRLVGVISHVRAVAERIETVLSVSRTPAGSEARWISGPERESLIEDELEEELEEGLLA